MILVRPNSQLVEDETKAMQEKSAAAETRMTMLASYISNAFSAAETHRQSSGVTDRLTTSRRLKHGIYENSKLQQIRSTGGSEMFYNIVEPKCEAFVAWMTDVFNSGTEAPWGIEPTPLPALSVEETEAIQEQVVSEFMGAENPDPEIVKRVALELYDEAMKRKEQIAKDRANKMQTLIEDQTEEGGFTEALSAFFNDLGDYPSAILKGPVFHNHKRLKWEDGQIKTVDEVIPSWTCVDPFNFYPGPNAKNLDQSYVCEIIDFDRGELANMRGLPGWNKEAIEKVLSGSSGASNSRENLPGESEMRRFDGRETLYQQGNAPDATIRAVEFWGNVEGKALKEWGMGADKITDDHSFYQVCCILVNSEVVRAILNPDPLGKKPYYVTSFIKNKNTVWGRASIPEKIRDCQDGVNVAQRNLMNNLAFGAGPQVSVDIDAIPPSHVPTISQQYPMKVWPYNGKQSPNARQPVSFFQPETRASELIAVADFFEKKADDRTLIPRYVTGDQDIRGAGATASGLSMLMNAATRGIKRVIRNVDQDIIRPAIRSIYVYNMLHNPDDSLKGDAQIVPQGAVATLVKEQMQIRRQEFLNMTNNPTDMQIIGPRRRANLLREIAKSLNLPEDKIVPSEQEIAMQEQQAALAAAQNPPPEMQ
jgi:hypothetical protein